MGPASFKENELNGSFIYFLNYMYSYSNLTKQYEEKKKIRVQKETNNTSIC